MSKHAYDFSKQLKWLNNKIQKGESVQPADLVAHALPELMGIAAHYLYEYSEKKKLDTNSDAVGIIVYDLKKVK